MGDVKRLQELDALRGIAALAVVFYHYTSRYDRIDGLGYPDGSPLELYLGRFGVEMFFMISGFVIFMTISKLQPGMQGVTSFAWARFSRLYPAYWAAMAVTFLVVSLFGLPGREVTLAQIPANLTMVPALLKTPMVDGVYWTLEKELIFYFWMAVILMLGLMKGIRAILLAWLLVAACGPLLATALGREEAFLYKALSYAMNLEWMPYFALGMLVYLRRTDAGHQGVDALIFIAAFGRIAQDLAWSDVAVVFALWLFLQWVVTRGCKWLMVRPLMFLGAISYPLYLIHQNVGYVIIRELLPYFAAPWLPWLLAIAASILLASLITYRVEKPAMAAIRAMQNARKGRVGAQGADV